MRGLGVWSTDSKCTSSLGLSLILFVYLYGVGRYNNGYTPCMTSVEHLSLALRKGPGYLRIRSGSSTYWS